MALGLLFDNNTVQSRDFSIPGSILARVCREVSLAT